MDKRDEEMSSGGFAMLSMVKEELNKAKAKKS